ncbi:hypothetical protein [Sphingobium sp. Ant17]|uniref:hypothetical protein n=1 Tax=Sphingobium sp. Ant17 TaxID=1461752 RepID=UPI00044A4107|nr:hypothetical protein [Sphingobium sp. Ant17]EXS70223.1 hypothetical protein BF95_25095 [Sphingobium sp. Ant17]MDE0946626.1 hypothetical protein [Sphingobium sp.]|tara:strand:- start:12273 stop:12836 length:564 start_codon:yes stop_codon:yes gene_type:complete
MIRLLLPALLVSAAPAAPAADMRPADPVLRTLLEGDAAHASGNHAALLNSVQALKALGATPAEGQEDLAARWTSDAKAHGATPSTLAFRGRALGPAYRRGSLVPGASMTMRQLFLGGQRAQISVAPASGDAANLSIRVHGADGKTLCAKPVGGPQVDCAWLPIFTDRYDIVIENGGKAAVGFYLILR